MFVICIAYTLGNTNGIWPALSLKVGVGCFGRGVTPPQTGIGGVKRKLAKHEFCGQGPLADLGVFGVQIECTFSIYRPFFDPFWGVNDGFKGFKGV